MKKKKIKKSLKYSKNRVVLSDTLPYETPLTFSNRYFYNFLDQYEINFSKIKRDEVISWAKQDSAKNGAVIEELVKVLFDLSKPSTDNVIILDDKNKSENRKIPFVYRITHKEKDYRELAIPHPKSQLELVKFYEDFKELILYYSKESKFSIRKPFSIAKFIFNNDRLNKQNTGDNDDFIESGSKEYENLKTFFTYKKYSNIYKFYEDYHYHRSEKKYNKMFKFDIAKCFDSIYTHSISWAIYNKEIVKDNLGFSKQTFPGQFDNFMQSVNYGETNGIIIGPEFSRIFAELILQQIDKSVETDLRKEDKLFYKTDYEVYRYVDDFFVFYNDDNTKDKILSRYKLNLKEYKMSISESKTHYYNKPLITELTIAKEKMGDLFSKKIKFSIEDYTDNDGVLKKLTFECDSNHLITRFKILVKESKVEYKDIMNYTLAIINKRVERGINKFENYYSGLVNLKSKNELSEEQLKKMVKQEKAFTDFIIEILDFTFFLYTVAPRVNSTIKLTNILSGIMLYYKGKYKFNAGNAQDPKEYKYFSRFDEHNSNRELIFKKISDEVNLILFNNKSEKHIQIETLYLFIILRELGRNYKLTQTDLIEYFKLKRNETTDSYEFAYEPNYFIITVLLFYIRNINGFEEIKEAIKAAIIDKIKNIDEDKRKKSTELVLLFFDILVCPFVDDKFKREVMVLFDIPADLHCDIINFKKVKKYWFTKWDNFNLAKELTAKKSLEVYD
ncbi:MAG: antiviral reverse transcriptase Drt3b [Lutibacter sp.]|nr:antiviral reverse transcriptase Drt3b [Lutibacter sp.]